MNLTQFLSLVRQYAALSRRMHKSYAPVVDALTSDLKSAQALLPVGRAVDDDTIDDILEREYPSEYRSFPLTRP